MIRSRVMGLLAALLIAVTGAQTHFTAQQPQGGNQSDRTTPILKQMTPKQRRHARLFTNPIYGTSRILDEHVAVDVIEDRVWKEPTQRLDQILTELACTSDAVFVAHVRSVESWPTEGGHFLFSEYAVTPTEVFRSVNGAPVTPGQAVTVVRPGGQRTSDGLVLTARIDSFPPLEMNGRYVFFLKYLPDTGAFQPTASEATLIVRGSQVMGTVSIPATDANMMGTGAPLSAARTLLRGVICR